ncbi:MAG: 16S rRNA (cytosine(1402)-N(4))-methyltransferase RsmH [Litorimonas sp.]
MKHYPVMLPEVLSALAMQAGETCVDGTFGNGGYSEAILNSATCKVIGLDRDPNVAPRAADMTAQWAGRFRLIETPFSKMDEVGLESVDAVVLDIGVSSMQLDQAERGFSFMREGPLDMRMEQGGGPTARDAVLHLSVAELTRIFQVYGEEKRARHVANCIVSAREQGDILTTSDLADILEKALGRRGKTHPATRVFQALRIFVNDELGELYKGLCAAERILKPGGRLVVVTFHSLEDRIVKSFLRRRAGEVRGGSRYAPEVKNDGPAPSFDLPKRSVTKPSKSEIDENARSRSAKLRLAVRTEALVIDADDRLLPNVISLAELEARL